MKYLLLLSAIASFPMFLLCVHKINAMRPDTAERIRWAVIISAIGYGAFVLSPIAYKESMWLGMKMGGLAALLVVVGNVMMSFFNRRRRHDFHQLNKGITHSGATR